MSQRTTQSDLRHIEAEMRARSEVEAPSSKSRSSSSWEQVAANWPLYLPEAIATWPDLAAETLQETQGDYGRLRDLLEKRYALSTAEAERQLDDWLDANRDLSR